MDNRMFPRICFLKFSFVLEGHGIYNPTFNLAHNETGCLPFAAFLVSAIERNYSPGLSSNFRSKRISGFVHGLLTLKQGNELWPLVSAAVCRRQFPALKAAGSSDSVGGAAQSYLSRIPPHLHGIAVRNIQVQPKDYMQPAKQMDMDPDEERIQKELDEEDDEEDVLSMMEDFDQTKEFLDLDLISSDSLQHFDGDIDDAMILRDLRGKLDPSDFSKIFGNGVGDLL
jgi:hypothetical protein